MTIRILTSTITILFLTQSCNFEPNRVTEQELKQAIDNAQFNNNIVSELTKYESFKDFLTKNIDTLINFRSHNNAIIKVGVNNKTETVIKYEECYTFFKNNPKYDINSVPNYLKSELKKVWSQIGQNCSFTICKGNEIRVVVETNNLENGLYISHELIWQQYRDKNHLRYLLQKDTSLTPNCIYRLGLTEHYGH